MPRDMKAPAPSVRRFTTDGFAMTRVEAQAEPGWDNRESEGSAKVVIEFHLDDDADQATIDLECSLLHLVGHTTDGMSCQLDAARVADACDMLAAALAAAKDIAARHGLLPEAVTA